VEQPIQVKGALALVGLKTLFGCVSIGSLVQMAGAGVPDVPRVGSTEASLLLAASAAVIVGELLLCLVAMIIIMTGRSLLAWQALVVVCAVLVVESVTVSALGVVTSLVAMEPTPGPAVIVVFLIWPALLAGAFALVLTRPARESFVPDPQPVQPVPAFVADGLDRAERGE
jgi:hypothetical protein